MIMMMLVIKQSLRNGGTARHTINAYSLFTLTRLSLLYTLTNRATRTFWIAASIASFYLNTNNWTTISKKSFINNFLFNFHNLWINSILNDGILKEIRVFWFSACVLVLHCELGCMQNYSHFMNILSITWRIFQFLI